MAAKVPVTSGDTVTNDSFDGFGPVGGTILASGAFNAGAPASVEFSPPKMAQNGMIMVNVTVLTGTSVAVFVDSFDKASGTWFQTLALTAIAAPGAAFGKFGVAIQTGAGVAANTVLTETMRVRFVYTAITALTLSVGVTFN